MGIKKMAVSGGGGVDSEIFIRTCPCRIKITAVRTVETIVPVEFDNETNITYELGYKQAIQEGRFVAQAAVYYTDWQDIVLRQFITDWISARPDFRRRQFS